eukprot:1146760-Pelagomonas_calceolata.AAC.5
MNSVPVKAMEAEGGPSKGATKAVITDRTLLINEMHAYLQVGERHSIDRSMQLSAYLGECRSIVDHPIEVWQSNEAHSKRVGTSMQATWRVQAAQMDIWMHMHAGEQNMSLGKNGPHSTKLESVSP